jgi:hypothetical protein
MRLPERKRNAPPRAHPRNVEINNAATSELEVVGMSPRLENSGSGVCSIYYPPDCRLAQVVSLNGVLASQAVNEVLQILTGFAGTSLSRHSLAAGEQADLQRGFKKLDGVRGTLEEWGGIWYPDCPHCSGELDRGAAAW